MQCYVYKGSRKEGAYLYLCREDDYSDVPEQLLKSLGVLTLALSFELHADRKLAQADPETVRKNLAAQGYHLQLPQQVYSLIQQLPNAKPPEYK